MSILGLTIDYGPFGFMDQFQWDYVCNSSDSDGRYSYAQQPKICKWNCLRLADCLVDQICLTEMNVDRNQLIDLFYELVEQTFMNHFENIYLIQMRKKVGIYHINMYM